jgi:hypothetical protein
MKRRRPRVPTRHKLMWSFIEAAEMTGIGEQQLRRDALAGKFATKKVTDGGHKHKIIRRSLEAYLEQPTQANPDQTGQ